VQRNCCGRLGCHSNFMEILDIVVNLFMKKRTFSSYLSGSGGKRLESRL